MQQKVLNMTFEEMASGLVLLPLDRLARWPNDGLARPAAVADGAFVVRHARLVQLLAAAAPVEVRRLILPTVLPYCFLRMRHAIR
jgi:hypothetical protein